MKTARHNFNLGDQVTVFNRTLGGKFIIEGLAIIREILPTEDMYKVHFDFRGKFEGKTCNRYVDPSGQNDPAAWLKVLNNL